MHALQHYIYANIVISSFFKETKGFHPFFFCNKAWDFYISYKYISPIHPRKKFQGSDVTHKMLNLYYFGLFVIFSTKEGILPPRNIKLVIDIGVIVMFLLAHTLSCRNRGNSSVPPCTHSQLSIRASVFPSMGFFICFRSFVQQLYAVYLEPLIIQIKFLEWRVRIQFQSLGIMQIGSLNIKSLNIKRAVIFCLVQVIIMQLFVAKLLITSALIVEAYCTFS
eukprot:TRINITY_DN7863_c0_g1_i12.p1 TRINITY_DN7863_c0_g1~~TRINITY_DN7863_c0_g1_i12.p1  ORF type:complete len:222 (-),score=-8.34 TRINITY_DN7863_c0_g1_i12:172-837(-)